MIREQAIEQNPLELRDYCQSLKQQMIDMATAVQPDFIPDSIHVHQSLEPTNSGLFFLSDLGSDFMLRPGGWGDPAVYWVDHVQPIEIKKTVETRLVEFGAQDLEHLAGFSQTVVDTEVNPLFICEASHSPGVGRPFHKVEVRIPRRNIWGEPVGQGPTIFSDHPDQFSRAQRIVDIYKEYKATALSANNP